MLHIKWKMLNNQKLLDGLTKIRECSELDSETSYRAGKVTERIVREIDSIYKKNMELIKQYAKRDEKGMLLPGKVPGDFEFDPGPRLEFEKEKEKCEAIEFVVTANKIDFSKLEACKLTPAERYALTECGVITAAD